jgi:predicted ATP-grasp superfamily ATP-dependent carboligase
VETNGTDIRALVVGDKVVAAMRRRAQREEKRSNIHAGGVGEQIQLPREVTNLAIDTARALGVDICGVDILESPLGPKVIEANISPGLQGLSKVTPVDLADEIAKFLFSKTEEVLQQKKKQEAAKAMRELNLYNEDPQEIITALLFRGERILLPEFVTKLTEFNERREYVVRAQKGKVEIREFKI